MSINVNKTPLDAVGRVRPMHLVNYTVRSESDGMLTLFRAAMPPGRSKR